MLLFVCKSLIFKDWQIKSGMARIWLWIFQETSRVRRASYFLSSQGGVAVGPMMNSDALSCSGRVASHVVVDFPD